MQATLAFACIIIIIAGLKLSAGLIAPILFAFTLTLLAWPVLQWLQKKGLPKWLAIAIVSATATVAILVLLFVVFYSIQKLSSNLTLYADRLYSQLQPAWDFLQSQNINTAAIPEGGIDGTTIIRTVLDVTANFLSNIFNVALFLFSLLLMIIASDSYVKKFKEHYNSNNSVVSDFAAWSKNIQEQYSVQTVSNLISGVLTTMLFIILQIDFAILWGILVFVLAYVPNIGIIIASIPPVLLAFILHGWQSALLTIALITLLNFLMDNVVTPRFMGDRLQVPTIIVFLSFTIWTWVFGPLGAFISLPLTLGLRAILAHHNETRFFAKLLAGEQTAPPSKSKHQKLTSAV